MMCSTTRTFLTGAIGLTMLLGACAKGGDPGAVEVLNRAVPSLAGSEQYVSLSVDGSCRTDCPPPAVSRGWLVDCAELDADKMAYVSDLTGAGFTSAGGDDHRATIDGVDIQLSLLTYVDAAEGPTATEEPYASDPSLLAGRCSIFVLATAS